MKRNFSLLRGLCLFLAFSMFTACQEDEQVKSPTTGSLKQDTPVQSRIVSWDAISANETLTSKLAKFNLSVNGKAQKQAYSTVYDFWVDTDRTLMLTRGNYTSYTMPVYRDVPTPGKIENLFLHPYNGGYLSFLLIYQFDTTDQTNLKQGIEISDILTKLTFRRLDNNDIDLSGTDADVPYTTYGGGFKAGDVIPYNGKCWRIDHINFYTDGSWDATVTLCTTCEDCGGGEGGSQNPQPAPIYQQYYQFIDIRGWGGGGSSAGGGAGGGGGINSPFNPDPGNYTPGAGEPENGLPIIGVVDPQLELSDLSKFTMGLNLDQWGVWSDPANSEAIDSIEQYLAGHNFSQESKTLVKSILDALVEYREAYPPDDDLVSDFVNDILDPSLFDSPSDDDLAVAPSCESFNYVSTASNWQEAAVTNIHFNVTVVSPPSQGGVYFNLGIEFPQPVLFGCPKVLPVGNTPVSAGLAAETSAKVLKKSMHDAVAKYGNKPVTNMVVSLFFQSRLKYNYPNYLPGRRVNFNASSYSVIPTPYITSATGTGNCM